MSQVLKKTKPCCSSFSGEVCKVQTLCGPQHACYQCAVDPRRQPLGDRRWGWHVSHDLGPWARGPPGIQTVWQWGVGHWERGWRRWEMSSLLRFALIKYFPSLKLKICVIPVPHQVMTVMWQGRTRSTTPSRPYPPTCDPWRVWSPTCSWKSPLWTKGEAMMLQMLAKKLLSSQKITFRNLCLSLYKKKKKASASKIKPILQSTFSFPATALPPPFWNNSAFSALLLSICHYPASLFNSTWRQGVVR